MKRSKVLLGALAMAGTGMLVPAASSASNRWDLIVRSERVDYEVGQRVDWTVDWTDHEPSNPDVDDVTVSLQGPHELVAGSVDAPRGWRVEYSVDGETYVADATGEVTHLRFTPTATSLPPSLSGVVADGDIVVPLAVPRPIPAISTASSGGDGYIPMLAGDRIYAVWHHMAAGATPEPNMVCIDTLTGARCPGYPKRLGWQTSFNQGQGVFVDGKLYIKNRDATTHGVYCWDTDTEEACGYTPVATLGPVTGTGGGNGGWDQFSSPVVHRGRMYFAGHNHRVYCFDPESGRVCDDYGLAGRATARAGEAHVTTRRFNDVVHHDGRMIFSLATAWADPIGLGAKDTCFDLDAGAPCANWGVNGVVTENSGTAYTFTRYDSSGAPIGYCHGVRAAAGDTGPIESAVPCYDFDGKNRSTIPAVTALSQFRPYNVEEDTVGTRTFFGRYSTFGAFCYDWATASPCAGAQFDSLGRSKQSMAEHFYGFVHRGDCVVGLGHKGIFVSIDPVTGASPCRQVTDSSHVASAASRYCRDTRYLEGWRLARVSGIAPGDFSRLDLSVTDGTRTVSGSALTGDLSLATLDPMADLRVGLSATVNPSADPWTRGAPEVNLVYRGSSQFCFQTVARAITAPIQVDAETNGETDSEKVVVDPTPADVDEPDESGTFVKGRSGPGTLPATGWDPRLLASASLALVVSAGVLRARRRAAPSR